MMKKRIFKSVSTKESDKLSGLALEFQELRGEEVESDWELKMDAFELFPHRERPNQPNLISLLNLKVKHEFNLLNFIINFGF